MRSEDANFLDLELLCAGAVVDSLAGHFDSFWNSRFAMPMPMPMPVPGPVPVPVPVPVLALALALALADNHLNPAQRGASFELLSRGVPAPSTPQAVPAAAQPQAANPAALTALTTLANLPLVVADARVIF